MDALEKKFDKMLQRLSSKSRRVATRRVSRFKRGSSSGSDDDDSAQQQMGTSKNDRKSSDNCRSHSKPLPTLQNTETTATAPTAKAATTTVKQFSEHLRKESSQQQFQEQKQKQEESAKGAEIADDQMSIDNHSQASGQLLSRSRSPTNHMLIDDSASTAIIKSTTHNKSCEFEDADYISDYSIHGLQRGTIRKSINELDMSMDESLPESCGRESGYLSGVDVRYSTSTADSPALSPLGVTFMRVQPFSQRTLETIMQQSFDDEDLQKKHKGILKVITVPSGLGFASDLNVQDEEAEIPDYKSTEKLLLDSITETKYITTIFELSPGGIVELIDDILNEFTLWFREEVGLLGIACEVQWSVPEKHRQRATEKRMKEAIHCSLRQNNRRILNMKSKTGTYQLPLTMTAAVTEENCTHDRKLKCFQGVYRRFYTSLLPYQHTDTGAWHKPYWSFHGINQPNPPQPNPKQFIFGHDATKLDSGSVVAVNVVALKFLKVKAENALEEGITATRLLRVKINDVDDNFPTFPEAQNSVPLTFVLERGNSVIGKLKALDADSAPYNSTYYYLLPSCSNRDGAFTIDKNTGVISVANSDDLQYDEYHLCALASAFNMSETLELAFDSSNASMITFTVLTEANNSTGQANELKRLIDNNTIHVFGTDPEMTIPITLTETHQQSTITYRLVSVQFTPAENAEIPTKTASYFSVDQTSGDIRIDPLLADYAEGVFTFDIIASQQRTSMERIQIAQIVKQVHNVKPTSLLKFVFDQNVHLLGLNLEDFKQHLSNALKMESSLSEISVVFGTPHFYKSVGRNRSSVCFHSLRNGMILGQESAISTLSATLNGGGALARLYQVFKVANIEPCVVMNQALSAGLSISRTALFWTGFSLVGILILLSFCIYACFIVKYKDYLNIKKAPLADETTSSTLSVNKSQLVQFYNINNLPTVDY